jgi:dihydroneopterin aldolase
MQAPDTIEIRRLRVSAHIGVPDDERADVQTLLVTIRMTPSQGFDGLADKISRTVDYYAVSLEIQSLAISRPRHLIETLATDIANHLLVNYPLEAIAVTIEKHILPDTECVAVHLERRR